MAFGLALGISPGNAAVVGYNAPGGQEGAMKLGTRILVVEDDRSIARLLELEFEHNGLSVRCAYDGPTGLELAQEFAPSVIVLDIMLPLMDGVCVLKRLRQRGDRAAVVMLTARDAVPDKVHSLKLGADDYMTKPFSTEELLARMGAAQAHRGRRNLAGGRPPHRHGKPGGKAGRAVHRADRQGVRVARVHGAKSPPRALARPALEQGMGTGHRGRN